VVAWTVVGVEVTVIVRDLAAAHTTLPAFLDSIRRDYGAVGAPRQDSQVLAGDASATEDGGRQPLEDGVGTTGTSNTTTAVTSTGVDGLRHRAPSYGTNVTPLDAAGSGVGAMS
jgi:hypothetical protein